MQPYMLAVKSDMMDELTATQKDQPNFPTVRSFHWSSMCHSLLALMPNMVTAIPRTSPATTRIPHIGWFGLHLWQVQQRVKVAMRRATRPRHRPRDISACVALNQSCVFCCRLKSLSNIHVQSVLSQRAHRPQFLWKLARNSVQYGVAKEIIMARSVITSIMSPIIWQQPAPIVEQCLQNSWTPLS